MEVESHICDQLLTSFALGKLIRGYLKLDQDFCSCEKLSSWSTINIIQAFTKLAMQTSCTSSKLLPQNEIVLGLNFWTTITNLHRPSRFSLTVFGQFLSYIVVQWLKLKPLLLSMNDIRGVAIPVVCGCRIAAF